MKKFELFLAVVSLALCCHFSIVYVTKRAGLDEIKRLTTENERLRIFNARRERRLKWMRQPEKIDLEIVAEASHILGTPSSVIASLLYCENGPEDMETGSIDKTDYFAKNFPISHWSALDGTRTLNRMCWEWFLTTDEGAEALPQMLRFCAKPYTALSREEQKAWAKNMQITEKRFRKNLKSNKAEADPIAYTMRTPTPTHYRGK